MGKAHVHVVRVPKPVTFLLLALTTAAMLALLFLLSGKAYAADSHPFREMLARLLRRGPVSRGALFAFLMPVAANVLLFVPWGFFVFVAADGPSRPRRRTYLLAVIGGALFATAIVLWQSFLPTRVTSMPDAIANTLGALAGAALGQARKDVRIRFQI
jgi:VanZ family protein